MSSARHPPPVSQSDEHTPNKTQSTQLTEKDDMVSSSATPTEVSDINDEWTEIAHDESASIAGGAITEQPTPEPSNLPAQSPSTTQNDTADAQIVALKNELQQRERYALLKALTAPTVEKEMRRTRLETLQHENDKLNAANKQLKNDRDRLAVRLGEARKKCRDMGKDKGKGLNTTSVATLACELTAIDKLTQSQREEVGRIAGALLDEVDRVTVEENEQNRESGLKELINEEQPASAPLMDGAPDERQKKIWNLEGVVEVLCGRVEKLEYEVGVMKRTSGGMREGR